MTYTVQNSALELPLPSQLQNGETVFLLLDSPNTPSCVFVPRQLSREHLEQMIPSSWITTYEHTRQI